MSPSLIKHPPGNDIAYRSGRSGVCCLGQSKRTQCRHWCDVSLDFEAVLTGRIAGEMDLATRYTPYRNSLNKVIIIA